MHLTTYGAINTHEVFRLTLAGALSEQRRTPIRNITRITSHVIWVWRVIPQASDQDSRVATTNGAQTVHRRDEQEAADHHERT